MSRLTVARMLVVALWFACTEPEAPVAPPAAHGWSAEAELVVAGLEEVERLWQGGQRDASRTLAERVYTDRFEPRLEPALREMEGDRECAAVEYAFGELLVALEARDPRKVRERLDALERRVRAVGDGASRAFPAPGALPAPVGGGGTDLRPLVPEVPPNWEGEEGPGNDEDESVARP